MTAVAAPMLPYMAEEIHSTLHDGDEGVSHLSVFARKWTPVSAEWNDPQAEQDMGSLLKMRSAALCFLFWKRLEGTAEVDIILPNGLSVRPYFLQLIEREETLLKTPFIVSDANITNEGSLGTGSFAWSYVSTMAVPDTDTNMEVPIRVRPSSLRKEYDGNRSS
ncbi:hypothetical protein M405DRAFT_841346 [Rhizopogon salebrosus TDB-379]|nr:hypothetical protein M405DRAFT_841346 [Rhizopogon salebrosus TDB-379]